MLREPLSLYSIALLVIAILIFSILLLSLIITIYISFVYHLPAAYYYYEPHKISILELNNSNESNFDNQNIEPDKPNENEIDENDILVESKSSGYRQISFNTFLSMEIETLSKNIYLEGSLTSPVWCTGVWHRDNALYFPSEETIHDSQMFLFYYKDIISARLISDGVEFLVSIRADPSRPLQLNQNVKTWTNFDLITSNKSNQNNINQFENEDYNNHDGIIRVTVRREFPDKDDLEPTRSDLYHHLVQHCPHLSKQKNKLLVILQAKEAKKYWICGLRYVFESYSNIIFKETENNLETEKIIIEYGDSFKSNDSKSNSIDGIFYISDDRNLESNLYFSLKKLGVEESPPLGIIQLKGDIKDEIGPLIQTTLKMFRNTTLNQKRVLKITLHSEASVQTLYTTRNVFMGWIPYKKDKQIKFKYLIRNYLFGPISFKNLIFKLISPLYYIYILALFLSLSKHASLRFNFPFQGKLKSFKMNAFHTYISSSIDSISFVLSSFKIDSSNLFSIASMLPFTIFKARVYERKSITNENEDSLFETPHYVQKLSITKENNQFKISINDLLINTCFQMDAELDSLIVNNFSYYN